MIILCTFQWKAISAKTVVVNFAEDAGQLYLHKKNEDIRDITDCKFDVINKKVVCKAEYKKVMEFTCRSEEKCLETFFLDYELRIPITRYVVEGNNSCTLTNGTTFKSSKLMAKNSSDNFVQAHALANFDYVVDDDVPFLPDSMTSSTPQRFDFVTTNGCKFSAYYDQVLSYNINIGVTG